ncbi:hypothetical protein [Paraclostridium ghonii]|uniref:Uncharacterized protein n=1 Tax=Paraclostridium ghonii TaxID=29358 RepID=A0ABU0N0Z7_9FIRM|nr:hypothetical protein [Paeniclostridium ghonii]MDQ0556534.1 hypothetical protein [Paeniclostridium ghonii]
MNRSKKIEDELLKIIIRDFNKSIVTYLKYRDYQINLKIVKDKKDKSKNNNSVINETA